jgi:hypothetical protein
MGLVSGIRDTEKTYSGSRIQGSKKDRIRIRNTGYKCQPAVFRSRIHMFLGLPDPDPLVRGMDPDPDPSIIMQNSKKNLDSFYFVALFYFLSLKNDVNAPSKSNKQKKLC